MGGDVAVHSEQRAAYMRDQVVAALAGWSPEDIERHVGKATRAFWLAADLETQLRWARLMHDADLANEALTIDFQVRDFESVTEITVYTADHAGLFTRLAGALSISRVDIVDARILTTNDGMALDIFWVQDLDGTSLDSPDRMRQIRDNISGVLRGDIHLRSALAEKTSRLPARASVFKVEPLVVIDNEASNTHTVIEVNGRDRPGILHDLTRACFDLSLTISNARISTYGERVVDVFYVKDLFGLKIRNETKLQQIRERLLQVLSQKSDVADALAEGTTGSRVLRI